MGASHFCRPHPPTPVCFSCDAELYPFKLREPIPQFLLPLQSGDEEPVVDLAGVLGQVYQEAALDFAIDYSAQPVPTLRERDFQWVQSLREA
ncbi:DUF4058 family protein [Lusitaniella coriacea]|uniref:DUF4058 family protein n=1 Tax=Lusitaniella coriacea TaxID=1983105 RepID=UPI003CFAB7C8